MSNRSPSQFGDWSRHLIVLVAAVLWVDALAAQVLPPPPQAPATPQSLVGEARLFVRGFGFEGNTAFSDDELAAVTAPFSQRELTSAEIEEARRAVTVHYISAGYGATIN